MHSSSYLKEVPVLAPSAIYIERCCQTPLCVWGDGGGWGGGGGGGMGGEPQMTGAEVHTEVNFLKCTFHVLLSIHVHVLALNSVKVPDKMEFKNDSEIFFPIFLNEKRMLRPLIRTVSSKWQCILHGLQLKFTETLAQSRNLYGSINPIAFKTAKTP